MSENKKKAESFQIASIIFGSILCIYTTILIYFRRNENIYLNYDNKLTNNQGFLLFFVLICVMINVTSTYCQLDMTGITCEVQYIYQIALIVYWMDIFTFADSNASYIYILAFHLILATMFLYVDQKRYSYEKKVAREATGITNYIECESMCLICF